ncbi:hypothetical protein FF1_032823 [Malus domestica]
MRRKRVCKRLPLGSGDRGRVRETAALGSVSENTCSEVRRRGNIRGGIGKSWEEVTSCLWQRDWQNTETCGETCEELLCARGQREKAGAA